MAPAALQKLEPVAHRLDLRPERGAERRAARGGARLGVGGELRQARQVLGRLQEPRDLGDARLGGLDRLLLCGVMCVVVCGVGGVAVVVSCVFFVGVAGAGVCRRKGKGAASRWACGVRAALTSWPTSTMASCVH